MEKVLQLGQSVREVTYEIVEKEGFAERFGEEITGIFKAVGEAVADFCWDADNTADLSSDVLDSKIVERFFEELAWIFKRDGEPEEEEDSSHEGLGV